MTFIPNPLDYTPPPSDVRGASARRRITSSPTWNIREMDQLASMGTPLMEVWFDGSSDGSYAAWTALVLGDGRKPRLLYGTARHVASGSADRWAARSVLRRLQAEIAEAYQVVLVSDRQENTANPVNRHPRLEWIWRSRSHPLIKRLDRMANHLRRDLAQQVTA